MLKLRIITPSELLFEGEAESVTLPGTQGSFMVLDRHAPIVSSLESGKVVVKEANNTREYTLNSGFVEVKDNVVVVCLE